MNDDELVALTEEFRRGILGPTSSFAMCAAVSWPLRGYLEFLGLRAEEAEVLVAPEGCNHVFLRLPDGRVLPTADQFNSDTEIFPPVYLGTPLRIHRDGLSKASHEAGR